MVPQLQFRARAALVFGELHNSIRMDRVRGISYDLHLSYLAGLVSNISAAF